MERFNFKYKSKNSEDYITCSGNSMYEPLSAQYTHIDQEGYIDIGLCYDFKIDFDSIDTDNRLTRIY